MRAMILAAGRGERLRPLTDTTPKPLLPVAGKPLIVWHIERLVAAGLRHIVINHAWLGQQIESTLGQGERWGACLHYCPEGNGALETAGGIANALPRLGPEPFLVVNGDVWCDLPVEQIHDQAAQLQNNRLQAWLLLAANPAHNPQGDFTLLADGTVSVPPQHANLPAGPAQSHKAEPCPTTLTFTGIGIYQPTLFSTIKPGSRAALGPLLRQAASRGLVTGSRHTGTWIDVGTAERLRYVDALARHWPVQAAHGTLAG